MTTTINNANRIDWHTMEWIKGVGQQSALMKFNGATDQQIQARVEKDYPEDIDYQTYLTLARKEYRTMWSRLAPHAGQGMLANLTWNGDLTLAKAENLARINDAGWNWIKELRQVA